MKKNAVILLTLCLFTVVMSVPARCQGKNTGIGIILGEPTGLSSKVWWDDNIAFDCGLAWSITNDPDLHIHGDVLWHDWKVLDDYFEIDDSGRLPLYYGIGGRIKAGDDTRVGIRFVIGVSYIFSYVPFDVFGEIAPVLDIAPETKVNFNVAFGGRFWF